MASLRDVDEVLERYWQMIAYACRYGHQPVLGMLGPLTAERLAAFNAGIGHWIKTENDSGGGVTNRFAEGG